MFDLQNQFSSSKNTIHLTGKLLKEKMFQWLTFNFRCNLTFSEYSRESSKIPPSEKYKYNDDI